MGIKRVVDTDFWTDDKVMELFTPEDKLFFLYLLTNPHCTPLGVYKIIPKQIAFEMGYSIESVKSLIDRFQSKYHIIRYSADTREIAIKNYMRYGIVSGGKPIKDRLTADIKSVKDKSLLRFISRSMDGNEPENQTVCEVLKWMKVFLESDADGNGFGDGDGNGDGNGDGDGDGDGESYSDSRDESLHESSVPSTPAAKKKPPKRFSPPTVEEVSAYCKERNNSVDPDRFVDYYTSNGWMVGKNHMKDWKASVRTWEKKDGTRKAVPGQRRNLDPDEIEAIQRMMAE